MSKIIVPRPNDDENEVHQKLDRIGINIDIIRDVIKLIDLQEKEEKKIERKQKIKEIVERINYRVILKRALYGYVILDYILNRLLDYYLFKLTELL